MIFFDEVTCMFYEADKKEKSLFDLIFELQEENKKLKKENDDLKTTKKTENEEAEFLAFFNLLPKKDNVKRIVKVLNELYKWKIEYVSYDSDRTQFWVSFYNKDDREVTFHSFINASKLFDSSITMNGCFDIEEYDYFNTIHGYIRQLMEGGPYECE